MSSCQRHKDTTTQMTAPVRSGKVDAAKARIRDWTGTSYMTPAPRPRTNNDLIFVEESFFMKTERHKDTTTQKTAPVRSGGLDAAMMRRCDWKGTSYMTPTPMTSTVDGVTFCEDLIFYLDFEAFLGVLLEHPTFLDNIEKKDLNAMIDIVVEAIIDFWIKKKKLDVSISLLSGHIIFHEQVDAQITERLEQIWPEKISKAFVNMFVESVIRPDPLPLFMKPEIFYSRTLPLIGTGEPLITISTPLDTSYFYSDLLKIVEHHPTEKEENRMWTITNSCPPWKDQNSLIPFKGYALLW